MHKQLLSLSLGALLCLLLLTPARAQDFSGSSVTVWGVIVDTDFGLVLNDGLNSYLLLGVDDPQLEGKACEITGIATRMLGIDAIEVERLEVVGDASLNNYSSSLCPGRKPRTEPVA